MKALISPDEIVYNEITNEILGSRIAQIVSDNQIFEVAEPLFWVDCDIDIKEYKVYWDKTTETIKENPMFMEV